MNLRDIKLSIVCGHESEEIKSLNHFFNDLFSGLEIYTKDGNYDLIFMKGNKFIMQLNLKYGYLDCRHDGFWKVLRTTYHCTYLETQEIIQYMVEDAFKCGALTPPNCMFDKSIEVEDAFKCGTLTPRTKIL